MKNDKKPWKLASGHRPRPTGAGPHDPRPNRQRTRSDIEREALDDQEFIDAMDALSGDDPERAHGEADELLLKAVSPELRAAYERLADRCDWWAGA